MSKLYSEPPVPCALHIPPPTNDPAADVVVLSPTTREPFRWQSSDGAMHAAEGAQLVRGDVRTHCMWTRCGQHDINPNSAWASFEPIDCGPCQEIEREHPGEAAAPNYLKDLWKRIGADG